jgi:hypothetical protein
MEALKGLGITPHTGAYLHILSPPTSCFLILDHYPPATRAVYNFHIGDSGDYILEVDERIVYLTPSTAAT